MRNVIFSLKNASAQLWFLHYALQQKLAVIETSFREGVKFFIGAFSTRILFSRIFFSDKAFRGRVCGAAGQARLPDNLPHPPQGREGLPEED